MFEDYRVRDYIANNYQPSTITISVNTIVDDVNENSSGYTTREQVLRILKEWNLSPNDIDEVYLRAKFVKHKKSLYTHIWACVIS